MKLEQQVCSLDLAKRLKELGVKQESLYRYNQYAVDIEQGGQWELESTQHMKKYHTPPPFVSAFTVAEIGEMLPHRIKNNNGDAILHEILSFSDAAKAYQMCYEGDFSLYVNWDKSEADARAKMLVYLIENKLITI